jgi:Effector Associated Constant Component 1
MIDERYRFDVGAEDQAAAGRAATALADILREADGVVEAARTKADGDTMDLGTVVSVMASSGATLALAQGLAAWLRARRGVTVTVEKGGRSGSLKATVSGLDPAAAVRIVELVRNS